MPLFRPPTNSVPDGGGVSNIIAHHPLRNSEKTHFVIPLLRLHQEACGCVFVRLKSALVHPQKCARLTNCTRRWCRVFLQRWSLECAQMEVIYLFKQVQKNLE